MGDLNRTDFIFWGGFPPHPPQLPNLAPDGPRIPPEMCSSSGGIRSHLGSSIFIVIGPMVRHFPGWPMYAKISPDPGGRGGAGGAQAWGTDPGESWAAWGGLDSFWGGPVAAGGGSWARLGVVLGRPGAVLGPQRRSWWRLGACLGTFSYESTKNHLQTEHEDS